MKVKDALNASKRHHFRHGTHPLTYLYRAGHLGLITREKAIERMAHWKKRHSTKAFRQKVTKKE